VWSHRDYGNRNLEIVREHKDDILPPGDECFENLGRLIRLNATIADQCNPRSDRVEITTRRTFLDETTKRLAIAPAMLSRVQINHEGSRPGRGQGECRDRGERVVLW
jgi:hypothetical protein